MVASNIANKFTKNQLLDFYKEMLTLRRFEEKAVNLYQQGAIGGFCHLYIGQEAVAVGIKAAAAKDDDYITSYRCHALAINCGVDPKKVMAELTGRSTGISKGKGGSMHMFDPEKHFWGGHGIVTAQVPLGTGIAFANKQRNKNSICYTFMGDGAANGGQMFESFNMAALWKLPVIYIIENNQYSMGTSAERGVAGELYKRGEPFNIPSKKVDGQDFFAVYEATKEAAEHVRSGKGPYLIEMDTYRYRGHSMSDPATYRSKDEVKDIKENRDPILTMAEFLKKNHKVSDGDLKAIDKKIKAEMAEVADFALNSPLPAASELMTDIMAGVN